MKRGAALAMLLAATASLGAAGCSSAFGPGDGDRGKEPAKVRPLYVEGAEFPRVARAGAPFEVLVRGSLPNPGWAFLKWEIARGEEGAAGGEARGGTADEAAGGASSEPLWIVTPLIVWTLAPGAAVPQVTMPFEGSVRLDAPAEGAGGGRPAAVRVEVRGFSPQETIAGRVEVVPAATLLDLEVTGGFIGIRERVRIARDGAIEAERKPGDRRGAGRLSAADLAAVTAAREAARLADLPPVSRTENAADLFEYDLADFGGERAVRVIADDLAMTPGFAALVRLVREKGEEILGAGGR